MTAINLPHADPAPRLLSVGSQKRRTIFNIFRIFAEFVICMKTAPYMLASRLVNVSDVWKVLHLFPDLPLRK